MATPTGLSRSLISLCVREADGDTRIELAGAQGRQEGAVSGDADGADHVRTEQPSSVDHEADFRAGVQRALLEKYGKQFKLLRANAAAGASSAAFKTIRNKTRANKLVCKKSALALVRNKIPETVDALNESDDALWERFKTAHKELHEQYCTPGDAGVRRQEGADCGNADGAGSVRKQPESASQQGAASADQQFPLAGKEALYITQEVHNPIRILGTLQPYAHEHGKTWYHLVVSGLQKARLNSDDAEKAVEAAVEQQQPQSQDLEQKQQELAKLKDKRANTNPGTQYMDLDKQVKNLQAQIQTEQSKQEPPQQQQPPEQQQQPPEQQQQQPPEQQQQQPPSESEGDDVDTDDLDSNYSPGGASESAGGGTDMVIDPVIDELVDDLKQRVQNFDGTVAEAQVLVMDLLNHELSDSWVTECQDGQRMGTILTEALEYIITVVKDKDARVVYDIGAGYGAVVMILRLVAPYLTVTGCEKCKQYCDKANEIGAAYFAQWEPIVHSKFEDVTLDIVQDTVYYVNNLAFGENQDWLVKALQPLDLNEDSIILSTSVIPGMGSRLNQCKFGDAFTLLEESGTLKALHSRNETDFKFRKYGPVPLKDLFAHKKPYASENGNRSFNVLAFGTDEWHKDWKIGACLFLDINGEFSFDALDEQSFWNSRSSAWSRLSTHSVTQYEPEYYTANYQKQYSVRNKFKATFSRNDSKNLPSLHRMRVWMILWCSEAHDLGQGFLDVVDVDDKLTQLQKLARACGQFRGEGDYLLPNENLKSHGIVPFKRTGHPEYEKATGIERTSEHIGHYECYLLQTANAAGKDILTAAQVYEANPGLEKDQNPTLLQVGQALEHYTALMLKPQDDLHGNLYELLQRTSGMYMVETSWPGQRYQHTLLWDAGRNFLCMGRTVAGSLEQHTIRPVGGDKEKPAERLKDQYGYVFTVNQVYQVMIKTRRLAEIPLAAYNPPPLTERQMERERRKEAKRKAYFTRETRSSKRARTKVTAHVPPSHGRAFSSDEDGDGPHSDPAVLAAIAAIEDPAVRQYAEQRCTEASGRAGRHLGTVTTKID